MVRVLPLLASLLFVMACSGMSKNAPDVRHYFFGPPSAMADAVVETPANVTSIRLVSLTVPDYLQQSRLVMLSAPGELEFATYHLWAEDPANGIGKRLVSSFNEGSSPHRIVRSCGDCPGVSIDVDHFYPTKSGEVILTGSIEIATGATSTITRSFAFDTQLTESGYGAAVKEMGILIDRLSESVAESLQTDSSTSRASREEQ